MKKIELFNDHFQNEEWRDVSGYENYQVSSFGRVRSKKRSIKQLGHKNDYCRIMQSKILKPKIQNSGYMVVWLSKNGKSKALTVHRLVAKAFLSEINGYDVNHKDGNKHNNLVENLEWIARSENIKHSYRCLLQTHNSCKVLCVETGNIYSSIREAGLFNNITPTSIGHVLSGRNKTAGGYK